MAKISELPDAEAKQHLYDSYMAAHEAHAGGAEITHPSNQVRDWRRAARDSGVDVPAWPGDDNTGLGPKEIERTDHGADNPPEFAGKPPNPAQDSAAEAIEEARILNSGSATMDADLHAARARRSDPRKIRGMSLAIKGYDRIK